MVKKSTKSSSKTAAAENCSSDDSDLSPVPKQSLIERLPEFIDKCTFDLPPNIKTFPLNVYANLQKSTMFFFLLYLMWRFKNYSLGAFVYVSLHASYGFMWNLKTLVFPDKSHSRRISLGSLPQTLIVIFGYSYIGYFMMSGQGDQNPNAERICIAVSVLLFGSSLMMVTDAQKYFTLKYKKGLISDGMLARSRNMNYVGEMMIYGSFAYINNSYIIWAILLSVWCIIFSMTILVKEISLRKKEGSEEYLKRSWILIPKLFSSGALSVLVYSLLLGAGYYVYSHGGMTAQLQKLHPYIKGTVDSILSVLHAK